MATRVTPPPFVLDPAAVPGEDADALLDGVLAADADVAVVEVNGAGAVQCLQGLLTNDLERPGTAGFVYGAVLTPKGMIVCDLWAARDGTRFLLTAPSHGRSAVLDLFQRTLPPRLARFTDRTDDWGVLRLAGPEAVACADAARIEVPDAGRTLTAIVGEAAAVVSRPDPEGGAPFQLQLLVPRDERPAVRARLVDAGAAYGPATTLELARILAGWPRLGAEIDDKTLPQEVRFDEIGGVSYTKGCYTGQETVARVHFRGRTNRRLVGLVWDDPPDVDRSEVTQNDSARGRVSSIAWLAPVERYIGLAVVRREVDAGDAVTAAGAPAAVRPLPFDVDG